MQSYFVRIGSLAEIRVAIGQANLKRNQCVIVRTGLGLQVAELLGLCHEPPANFDSIRILRAMTTQDELLVGRLTRHRRQAIERCREAIAKSGSRSVLLDVDQVLDGGTLIMHFLGEVDSIADKITKTIVEEYESIVRSRHFAKLLRDGCGPDCGTEDGGGCGTGGCSGCAAAVVCHSGPG